MQLKKLMCALRSAEILVKMLIYELITTRFCAVVSKSCIKYALLYCTGHKVLSGAVINSLRYLCHGHAQNNFQIWCWIVNICPPCPSDDAVFRSRSLRRIIL